MYLILEELKFGIKKNNYFTYSEKRLHPFVLKKIIFEYHEKKII